MFSSKSKILIVDDSETMRKTLQEILMKLGFLNIDQANDGEDAYNYIERMQEVESLYDLIICDINMPKLNGIELLERCKASLVYKNIPFILVTTESEKGVMLKALMEGANSYIVKPFSAKDLEARMKQIYQSINA